MIASVRLAVEAAPEAMTETVYFVAARVAVGVPVISPFVELNDRPGGSAGVMLQTGVPASPILIGMMLAAIPAVSE